MKRTKSRERNSEKVQESKRKKQEVKAIVKQSWETLSETFEREEKMNKKKRKSSRNFGEFVEFLLKSHEDQMNIRIKEI